MQSVTRVLYYLDTFRSIDEIGIIRNETTDLEDLEAEIMNYQTVKDSKFYAHMTTFAGFGTLLFLILVIIFITCLVKKLRKNQKNLWPIFQIMLLCVI